MRSLLALGPTASCLLLERRHEPLECRVEELPATKVLRTVLGGKTVHDTGAL